MSLNKFAIDFDSAVTNIYKLGSGVVLSEPTVAAVEYGGKKQVKAIGNQAFKLIGKTTKNTKIVFPVFEGEIVNEKVAGGLLAGLLKKAGIENSLLGATAVMAVPCGITGDMLEKYKAVAKTAGLGKVYYVESPILSALGQHVPITDSSPSFIIDMAGGVTNIATVSTEGVIAGVSVNLGGNKICADIIDYIAEKYGLLIGLQTAERLKREIGSLEDGDSLSTIVNGRDMNAGTPKAICIKAKDILEPIKKYYDKISEIGTAVLKKLPPEVSAEIRHSGIYVSGSASTVYGLKAYFEHKFNMQVNVAENGAYSVALGGGVAIGNTDLLKRISLSLK